MSINIKDFIGNKFNRLTVIKEVGKQGLNRMVECKCECGNIVTVRLTRIKTLIQISCGCYGKEQKLKAITKHGMTNTKIFKQWAMMKQRCELKTHTSYPRYGGRGISVCNEWQTFKGYYDDFGYKWEKGLQIDRIDNDGNYCKENCKWVTPKENARNRSNNNIIKHNGKEYCLAELIEISGLTANTIKDRLKNGIPNKYLLQKEKIQGKLYSFNGMTLNLSLWCKELGLSLGSVKGKIRRGMTVEKSLGLDLHSLSCN